MPTKNAKPEPEETADDFHDITAPDGMEFETLVEESPTAVIFEKIGEEFVGQYIGSEHVELPPDAEGKDQSFDRFLFRAKDGKRYAINKSYALDAGMGKANEGEWVRITYTQDIPTKRALNPMKDFRIEVAKRS